MLVLISSLTDKLFCPGGFNMIFRSKPSFFFSILPYPAVLTCLLPQDEFTRHLHLPVKNSPFPPFKKSFPVEVSLVTGIRIHSRIASWSELESEALYKPIPTTFSKAGYNIHEKVLRWHLWDDISRENPRNNLAFFFLESMANILVPLQMLEENKRKGICRLMWWARVAGCFKVFIRIPTLFKAGSPYPGRLHGRFHAGHWY